MRTIRFTFSGARDALMLLWAARPGRAECDGAASLEDAFGHTLGTLGALEAGLYRLWLRADGRGAREVTLRCTDGVTPVLLPGPGITPSHMPKPEPSLTLAGGQTVEFFAPVGENQRSAYLAAQNVSPERVRVSVNGEAFAPEWMPKFDMPYRAASVPVCAGELCVRADIEAGRSARVTVWEGNPLALSRPERPIPMGEAELRAETEAGAPMDARFEVFVRGELVMQRDVLRGETCAAELPEGEYTLCVSHGARWSRESAILRVLADRRAVCRVALRELLPLPAGWAWGDEHLHSVFEDGAPLPDRIMRAARACGCQFAFLTDHDVEGLLRFGVSQADEQGTFVGMPGQEIVIRELHANVLNAAWQIDNPIPDYNEVHPDIEAKISGWLDEVERMKRRQPCAIMLNHPHHNEPAYSSRPYFRSWWVRDRFPAFGIVESFDFISWFDRLNRGERLCGAWTTDSHDCTYLYPGRKGTCLYVGGALTPERIIDALANGRAFCARDPGATLLLQCGDAHIGDTVRRAEGEAAVVRVFAQSTLPIESVEIIANGRVVAAFDPRSATRFEADVPVPEDALWMLARMRQRGGEWEQDGHSFEPLMTSGYCAFTNPIYFR